LGIVALVLCRYSGEKIKYIMMMIFGALASVLLLGGMASLVSNRFDYIQKRFTYFLNTNVDPQSRDV
jgi:cell division protein FtsW (lipid II flippase)